MKVVLPAPLGPIRACTSPASTLKFTPCSASTAAKRRDSLRTSSSGSAMAFPKQGSDAFGGEEYDGKQQQAEGDVPVFGEADQAFFEDKQDHRSDDTTIQVANTADDDHDQQGAGLCPLQEVGAGQPGQVGEQGTGQSRQRPAKGEADQAI